MPPRRSEHGIPVFGASSMNRTVDDEQQECDVHYLIACPICDTSWQSLSTFDKEKLLENPASLAQQSATIDSGASYRLQQNLPLITPIGYHDDYPVFPVLSNQSNGSFAAPHNIAHEDGSETDSSSEDEVQEISQSRIVVLGQPEIHVNHRSQQPSHLILARSSSTRRLLSEGLKVEVSGAIARFTAQHGSKKHIIYIASSSARDPGSRQLRFSCALQWTSTAEHGLLDSYAFTLEQSYSHRAGSNNPWLTAEVRALLAALQVIDWTIECQHVVVGTSSDGLLQTIRTIEDERLHNLTSMTDVLHNQGNADLWQLIYNEVSFLSRHGCSVEVCLVCREDVYHVNVASLATVQARRAWTDTAHYPACSPIRPVLLS